MTGTERQRAPRRDAAANRENLIDAARTVLNIDPEASLDAVAHAAGLSRRSFYAHFPTREALVNELVERGAQRVTQAALSATHDDPVVELALIARVVWDQVENVRAMTQVAVRSPLRERIRPTLGPLHDRIVSAVVRAADLGTGRRDLDPQVVSRLIEGSAFNTLDEANRWPLGRDEGRRMVMLVGLSALGLSWREANTVLTTHADLLGLTADAEREGIAQQATVSRGSAPMRA